jgi:hypothetical protein
MGLANGRLKATHAAFNAPELGEGLAIGSEAGTLPARVSKMPRKGLSASLGIVALEWNKFQKVSTANNIFGLRLVSRDKF